MTIQVLVPCLNKSKEDIVELCDFLNIQTDAIFLNQTGKSAEYELCYQDHQIKVVETEWRGVSRARNELIRRANADIGLFIDDDCVLAPEYPTHILCAYSSLPEADFIRFNTRRDYWNPVGAHTRSHKKASFRDLSSLGMWGLSFKCEKLRRLSVRFNESLGAPNYLYNGEDSVFLYDLCKATDHVYLDPFFVCEVKETKQSTWFESYDKRYFVTKGFVYSHLYGNLWGLALLRMYVKYRKEFSMSFLEVKRHAKLGHYLYVRNQYNALGDVWPKEGR